MFITDPIDYMLFAEQDALGGSTTGQAAPHISSIGYECAYPHLAEEVAFIITEDGADLVFARMPAQRAYM